jgi:thiol-disulfide isomerase/thioredoxin
MLEMIHRGEIDKEDEVLILTDENFDREVQALGTLAINFFQPWCPYSRMAEPEIADAAATLEAMNCPYKMAKVHIGEN